MDVKLKQLKEEFLMLLYSISKLSMIQYIADFIKGEDAFLLRLYLNGAMKPTDLSDDLKITKGRVTALIRTLKRKKLIVINKNPNDKRSVIVNLSDSGKSYLEDKLNISENYFDELFEVIGVKDAKQLIETIKTILGKIEEVDDE